MTLPQQTVTLDAYYTLSGIKLNHKPQQEGIYIRVKNGKSQKVTVRREP